MGAVPGRPVWNQHAYYLTNSNNDGSIPATPDINWEQYNTFRSGDQGAGQGGEYPDLVVEIEDVCTEFCDVNLIYVYGRIGNQGVSQIDGDVVVDLQGITPDGFTSLKTHTLTGPFPPGKMYSTFTLEVNTAGQELYGLILLVDKGNDDEGDIFECNEINDQAYWTDTVCQ